ncbi:hypothetical protein LZ023_35815 (plasmid) [Pseudomonas silvicola]|nr:hypothetical protein LZ023_35815 [Pseudomonas silvicola]
MIYLFYFGGRQVVSFVGKTLGMQGPFDVNGFVAGAIAIGLISGAYQSGVFRGAFYAIERHAGSSYGDRYGTTDVVSPHDCVPQALRHGSSGNGQSQWQSVIKDRLWFP